MNIGKNMNIMTRWRQKATITVAVLVNLMGVYSLYSLHRSGFFVIPESEAVTDSATISSTSACTAQNDVIAPTALAMDLNPALTASGLVTAFAPTLAITGVVDGDTSGTSTTGTASFDSTSTKLTYRGMWDGPVILHNAACQGLSALTATSNALVYVDSTATPFVVTIGSASASAATDLTALTTTAASLHSAASANIDAVDPTGKSFVKYGTSGDAAVDVLYKIGMQRTIGISAVSASQTRSVTFTSTVVN